METKYIEKVKEINKGKNLKYYILTMGCQLNENDSEKLCGMVEEMGYQPTEEYKEADLVIFNTCCVRENAEDKLFGKLGELKKVKETYNRQNTRKLFIYRHNIWNTHIAKLSRRLI